MTPEQQAHDVLAEQEEHPSSTLPAHKQLRYPFPEWTAACVQSAIFGADRVMRGVAAKRKILGGLLPDVRHADELVEREWGSNDDCAERLLCLLASEWDIHPDYRPEWKLG